MSDPPRYNAADLAQALGVHPPTPQQTRIIESPLVPSLVIAGAGSGKTETMASRVIYLVANQQVAPDAVLGLTFTRKAAWELAERLRHKLHAADRVLDTGDHQVAGHEAEPHVATYHSFAGTIVSEHGLRIGVEPSSRLLGQAAAFQLAHDVVHNWTGTLTTTSYAASSIVTHVLALAGECAEHLITPDDVADYLRTMSDDIAALPDKSPDQRARAKTAPWKKLHEKTIKVRIDLAPVVAEYARRKHENNMLDFGDQVAIAARIVQTSPDVVSMLREQHHVVLLDEYQDTSFAQLELLRTVFGDGHPVTAVGDPHQSIYAWRGASAGNLESFPHHFRRDDKPTETYSLTTSWRNDSVILDAANTIAEPLNIPRDDRDSVGVERLTARPKATEGKIRLGWYDTDREELAAIAQRIRDVRASNPQASAAVLCRRRSIFPAAVEALRAVGLPVEVVGLGGLLERPEIHDLIAMMQVASRLERADWLMRLLTGPRWAIGPRDLNALQQYHRQLNRQITSTDDDVPLSVGANRFDLTLIEALDRLSDDNQTTTRSLFSDAGFNRLRELARQIKAIRARAADPLPDFVAYLERISLVAVELVAVPGRSRNFARAGLDEFHHVVSDFVRDVPNADLPGFLSWLDAALELGADRDDSPTLDEETEVDPDFSAIQVMTVHAAKGLEWDVIAIPRLVEKTFPAAPKPKEGWLGDPTALPTALRGDSDSLPPFTYHAADSVTELCALIDEFSEAHAHHEELNERRLMYVAVTRARHELFATGSSWSTGRAHPDSPSPFLRELTDHFSNSGATTTHLPPTWPTLETSDEPPDTATATLCWPYDPLGARRPVVELAAQDVRQHLAAMGASSGAEQPQRTEWSDDVDALLAEYAATHDSDVFIDMPHHLSASRMVQLASDPHRVALHIRRPLPRAPQTAAHIGTQFHSWVEKRYGATPLMDSLDLPGAQDDSWDGDQTDSDVLRENFSQSVFADIAPTFVEVAVEVPIGGAVIRGRIDAVFNRVDTTGEHGVDIIDWKTGTEPTGDAADYAAVQLAVYRLAWSKLHNVPLADISAGFFYARTGRLVRPVDMLSESELHDLVCSSYT